MRRATTVLIDRLTRALGEPVATPEMISVGGGKLARARYRVWRWQCPACGGGHDDPGHQLGPVVIRYAPFVVDSDGRVWCEEPGCAADLLAATIRELTRRAA